MNTNTVDLTELGGDIANTVFGTMTETLAGFVDGVNESQWSTSIAQGLGDLVVAFLVIWGVFWVTRKIIRSARSTK